MMAKNVCIIGAGVSGLTCIKNALDEGLEAHCFEQRSWIGGLWNFTHDAGKEFAVAPSSTICNISKQIMNFSDFPAPMEFPNYMPLKVYQKYLEMYAEKFDLVNKITFDSKILQVKPCQDYAQTGKWEVYYEVNGERKLKVFDAVMVCSGACWNPFCPDIQGRDVFKGRQVHSSEYRDWRGFEGKKVIVVGLGNSGGDIACELSHYAAQVYLSTSKGSYVVSRLGNNGQPADHLAMCRATNDIPFTMKNWLIESKLKKAINYDTFGLKTNGQILRERILINDELPHRIITGTLIMKSKLIELCSNSAIFDDGTQIDNVDCIVYTTGFKPKFSFLSENVISFTNDGKFTPLYKFVFPPKLRHSTLAIIGACAVNGPISPAVEMQARWALKIFTGECSLPNKDAMMKDIDKKQKILNQIYGENKEFLRVPGMMNYLDEISSLFGARPNLWNLLLTDPKLALRCFFGPCVPFQYRLMGPGSWDGAKAAIESVPESTVVPTRTRKVVLSKKQRFYSSWFGLILWFVIVFVFVYFIFCLLF